MRWFAKKRDPPRNKLIEIGAVVSRRVFASFSAADSSSRARQPHHFPRRVRVDRTHADACRSRPPRAITGGEPSEGTPGGRGLAMAEVKPDEGGPGAEGEVVVRKEHDVTIVLSFMSDEHEKAAIEVRHGKRRRRYARARRAIGHFRVSTLRAARNSFLDLDLPRCRQRPVARTSPAKFLRVYLVRRSRNRFSRARLTRLVRLFRTHTTRSKRARRSTSTRSTRMWHRRSRRATTPGTRARA